MSLRNRLLHCAAIAAIVGSTAGGQAPRFADLHRMLPWNGNVSRITAGDLDGDGDVDVLIAINSYPPSDPNRLLLNEGTGSFVYTPAAVPSAPGAGTPDALGDLDGDGDLDVLATGDALAEPIPLWLNQGTGTFTLATGQVAAPPYLPRQVALGDLDGDGDLDALAANNGPETLLLNDGAGTFANASALVPPSLDDSESVALGD
ncbi:MAG: FG-GAP-like repeat-containing protein, partial [Planctomycetota bacterium]